MYVTECCYFYFPIGRGFGGPAFQALAEVCHTLGRSICFSATAALSFSVKHRPRQLGGGGGFVYVPNEAWPKFPPGQGK